MKFPVTALTVVVLTVVPVIVVPVRDEKVPVVNCAVSPVIIVPLKVPETVTPVPNVAAPLTPSVPVTVKLPLIF